MNRIFGYTALLSKQPRSRRCPPFSGWPLQEPRVALPCVHSFWLAGGAQVQTICLNSVNQPHPSPRCSISSSKLWPNSLSTPMHSAAKIPRTTPWCEVIYLYIRVMSGSDTNTEHLNSYSTKILYHMLNLKDELMYCCLIIHKHTGHQAKAIFNGILNKSAKILHVSALPCWGFP